MELGNVTQPGDFLLLGFYEWPDLHFILFIMFLLVYLMALTGNLTIFIVIYTDPHLHTPMYFFLFNLSILDLTFISTILPKLLDICLTGKQSITHLACMMQMSFFVLCVTAEYFLLAAMAYDRYVAICCPLRYPYLMNLKVCAYLALVSWGFGLIESFMFFGLLFHLSFCRSKVINHLFCGLKPLVSLSCTRIHKMELAIKFSGVICGFIPLVFILMSYILIIIAILRIRSSEGKRKAFSTCSSHLTVVIMFFGIILSMYMAPASAYSVERDKILAVLYTSCIPTLNPVIYSLRNKDMKEAIKKLGVKILNPKCLVPTH